MIRKRTFNLRQKSNVSSWSSFEELYQYLIAHKAEFVKTFAESAYDHNFDEPMNALVLVVDSKKMKASDEVFSYAEKINAIFAEHDKQVVIDTRLENMPLKYRNRVHLEHTWFIKENL